MKARLIRITPQVNKSTEETFYNYGFCTKQKASEVLSAKDWKEAKLAGQRDEPLIFSIASDVVLPAYVNRHIFDIANVVITLVHDDENVPFVGKNGMLVFNGLRASEDVYPLFNYVERGGAEVKNLPPAPEGWHDTTSEKEVAD